MSNQANICVVLHRLENLVKNDEDFAEVFSSDLENLLNDIHSQDGFGTEGQNDPRGDFRNGKWTMDNIEAQ